MRYAFNYYKRFINDPYSVYIALLHVHMQSFIKKFCMGGGGKN